MAKGGIKRPESNEPHGTQNNKLNHLVKDDVPPVPQMQRQAKTGKNNGDPLEKTDG